MTSWLTGNLAYLAAWLSLKIGCVAIQLNPAAIFRLCDRLADLGYRLFRGFRKRSLGNLRAAFGDHVNENDLENIARRSLRNFFRAFVEAAAAVKASDDELRATISVVGREHLDAALAKGNGIMVYSAHLGNFLLLGCRIALEGFPTFVLVNQPRDGRFAELMDDYRLRVRHQTIHARPRHHALRELTDVLRRNQVAVIVADEFRKGGGIPVSLFGKTVIARRGAVTLALRTGAAVIPACLLRQSDDSLKLVIEPEMELNRTTRDAKAIRENTITMTQWLERMVRAYPDQWNWMNIRWWANTDDELANHNRQMKRAV